MTEQNQNPAVSEDDDTEGHTRRPPVDDVERDALTDDTEGHGRRSAAGIEDDDDTEGHWRTPR